MFRQRYPRIHLQADKMVTQHERIFCAGGGMAWFDLTLLLIDRYCGHQVARDIAKSHVLDLTRPNQTVYAASRQRKHHQDSKVLAVQEDLETHYQQPLQLDLLAARHSITVRTLLRRFKSACGQTPGQYLQTLRIEHARRLLEQHQLSIEQVVRLVGYEDQSSFSRLFKTSTGLSPAQYRQQHQRK
jgi:transcriptional regulator GlxA family with amidase domain